MNTPYRGLLLSLAGALVAFAALVTYFTVAPSFPDWRDSGLANILLGGGGFLLGVVGVVMSFRARRFRVTSLLLTAFGGLLAGSLPVYIHRLSYQMPPAERAIAAGQAAPGFKLSDQAGRERALGEWLGKKVILVFFRGHW